MELSNIAVIGSGYWGKNLVRNFNNIGALKVICDNNQTTLSSFKESYPEVEVCLAFSDILSRDDIHGIVIATPAESHYNLAHEALLAGKHVYVEKPLVLDEREGEELINLAKEKKLILMVGHLLQYHPIFIYLKKLASSGELGRINYIYSNRLNLGKIRREENILWSFAPHDISMILSLAGEMPEQVYATGGNYLHRKIADVTTTHMVFPSGMRAHIFVSWLHPFKEQKLVVVGDKKMAVFDDTQPWEDKLLLYPHEINWQDNAPVPIKGDPERLDIPQSEPLRDECQHFLDCIMSGTTPITDGSEGLRVLKILNIAQQSLDLPQDSSKKTLTPRTSQHVHDYFIHNTAIVDENCTIGEDTKIWHFSHVLSNSKIGEKCNIGQNVVIGPDVNIGKQCKIQNNVSIYKGVTLEDGIFCGPSMVFTNIYNPRAEIRKMDQVKSTLVKHGATLGANCTIICGTTIGRYAFIGAGAVVNKNILDHALVVGNPAKQIGWACVCGERLAEDFECIECDKRYKSTEAGLVEV
jgi:UDP-2-acetamido-3-amino-2,3-dideoxy-glucuronate N-acetyltransferase